MGRPHPLFAVLVAMLVVAAGAGVAVDGRAPGYALDTELVYRVEVAAVIFATEYLLLLVLWLSWHGRTVTRVELPGGAAVEADPALGLEAAADALADYRDRTDDRLDLLEQTFDLISSDTSRYEGEA